MANGRYARGTSWTLEAFAMIEGAPIKSMIAVVKPLAAASARLRRRPGRPSRSSYAAPLPPDVVAQLKRTGIWDSLVDDLPKPARRALAGMKSSRHSNVTAPKERRAIHVDSPSDPASNTGAPRLLSVADTAKYLGVSAYTIRDWNSRGVLASARVRPPASAGNGDSRRVLFDRLVLDRLVDGWRSAVRVARA